MRPNIIHPHSLEILEARIAPAGVGMLPTIQDAELAFDADPIGSNRFVATVTETPILVRAGQLLTTGVGARSGTYLLFVEQGEALVFTTDFNNNKLVDFNEITGIAAGAGLRMISLVDINGDIVTNLDADTTLTDSNNQIRGDDIFLKGDGRLLRNTTIEKIELRSLAAADLTDQNGDGGVDELDVALRLALSSYSIHGNILAGAGLGIPGDNDSGLIIDDAGRAIQQVWFTGLGTNYFIDFKPTIGSIKVGTAASGEYFSFSITAANDIQGTILPFTPTAGQTGADISTVRGGNAGTAFNIHGLFAGNGGVGARGGNIENIQLNVDTAGGYYVVAGNGGAGRSGGVGGSIINFSDAGSVTSQVVIQSGSGGVGSANIGGDGGVIAFNETLAVPLNLNGGVSIVAGDGGNGLIAGGVGASIAKGVITAPEGTAEIGRNVVGSTRDGHHDTLTGRLDEGALDGKTGVIGRTKAVDFNNDGFGDIVFTTSEAEQLVVQFGDGLGGYLVDDPLALFPKPLRLYLDAPISVSGNRTTALAVGDFNGDGHHDIVAASSAPGAFGGIFVYLSHYEDANNNGLNSAEDANKNNVNDFLGFYPARQSPLPTLNTGDPDAGPAFNSWFFFYHSAHAINDVEVGDFDGDGYTDVAVLATYVEKGLAGGLSQVIIYLKSDIEDGRPTGEFYADFGTKAQAAQGANPLRPFTPLFDISFGGGKGMIEATALNTAATHDVILGVSLENDIDVGGLTDSVRRNFLDVWDLLDFTGVPSIAGPRLLNTIVFGGVDTDRRPGFVDTPLAGAFVLDFTVVDFNRDGRADFAEITVEPPGFLVAAQGNGAGAATVVTTNFGQADNRGFSFRQLNLGTLQLAIRPTDADSDGFFDEVAVLDYGTAAKFRILELQIAAPARNLTVATNPDPGATIVGTFVSSFVGGKDRNIVAWDIFFPMVPIRLDLPLDDPSIPVPAPVPINHYSVSWGPGSVIENPVPIPFTSTPLAEHYFTFIAGNGGDALIGSGGNGGFLGGGLDTAGTDLFGSLNVTLPLNAAFNGEANFNGGAGGQGFTTGGHGGKVSGVVVRYAPNTGLFHSTVNLYGGHGGIGVAAAGGDGGDIEAVSVVTGFEVIGGNGAAGLTGGKGGSLLGHGLDGFFDNRFIVQTLNAGFGGNGIARGGDGGGILNFKGAYDLGVLGDAVGFIAMIAGNGGTASSGPGGNGGSIMNNSPLDTVENLMSGDILMQAGNGGNGDSGGSGGSVDTFFNKPTTADNPSILSVIAGNGGQGVAGVGGSGGDVANIKTPTRGVLNPVFIPLTVYEYNRILAGIGGSSAGNTGGKGGSVNNIESKNEENPFVVVAGPGGAGLGLGGAGGSISNSQIAVGGSSLAKALYIAGDGGSVSAFIPNPLDTVLNQGEKAFGGAVGQAGNGGDISNITQLGGIASRMDLIAGNGGNTLNYGTIADQTTGQFVGKGGSVRNVLADGTIGNIRPGVEIRSYNKLNAQGETMADFININLRDPLSPGSVDDSVGNVGIVVGAAGRLKEGFKDYSTSHIAIYTSNPAFGGINGSLETITAREIMSAVAGSVERIAAIQSVSDLNILPGARVGVNKTAGDPPNPSGPRQIPMIDGKLVDGALVSSTQPTKDGNPFNYPGNVFVLN